MKKTPHVALARKYRPQRFEDVVGQDAIATTLTNAISSDQAGHAYLFFGPRGVGKTTSARLLAKSLNCVTGPTPKPCGKCPACEEIAAGSSIDVLELDAASNTQVDKIREMIIETVSLAPSRDKNKIFIIDEVHMLSKGSFNALLKTLEEPPPHVVFILATTEMTKIPATIISRCQRFRFRPIPKDDIAAHLATLAKAEKVKADKEALVMIAKSAGGAMRDGISLFDQACAYCDGKLTAEVVAELLGTLPAEFLLGIVGAVLEKDAGALAKWLAKVSGEGFDADQLLRDLRERLEELYLSRLGVSEALGKEWAALAKERSPETFSFLLHRVNRTIRELRDSESPQITLELGLYGMLEAAYDLGEWVTRLEALEKRLASGAPAPAPSRPAAAPSSPAPAASASPASAPLPASPGGDLQPLWGKLMALLREEKPSLATSLEGSGFIPGDGGGWRVVLTSSFHQQRAQSQKAFIEAELKKLAGKPVRLSFEAGAGSGAGSKGAEEGWVDSSEDGGPLEDSGLKKVSKIFPGRVHQVKKRRS